MLSLGQKFLCLCLSSSIHQVVPPHCHHTFNSGTVAIYYDGVSQALGAPGGSLPSSLPTSTQHLLIGRDGSSAGPDYLNGLIDDVRIYNRALSKDEIKRLYNMGR